MNKPLTVILGVCAAGALSAGAPVFAQQTTPQDRYQHGSTTSPSTTSQSSDSGSKAEAHSSSKIADEVKSSDSFVKAAAQDGLLEVQLGKLAQDKAQDQKVRDFAQRMVTDHSKANDELEKIAKQKGISIPTTLDKEHQATLDKLQDKSGKAFDKAYMQVMVKDHRDGVALFKQASTASGVATDLQRFAKQTLPTLMEHQTMAKDAEKVAKESTRSKSKDKTTS
jgi:putative membrane protein